MSRERSHKIFPFWTDCLQMPKETWIQVCHQNHSKETDKSERKYKKDPQN